MGVSSSTISEISANVPVISNSRDAPVFDSRSRCSAVSSRVGVPACDGKVQALIDGQVSVGHEVIA